MVGIRSGGPRAAAGAGGGRVRAEEVPEGIAFLPGPDGETRPVTRITVLTLVDRREIRQFAADSTLLRSTYQRAEPEG
jgi:hypothetical protein